MSADIASALSEIDLASARHEFDIARERLEVQKERMMRALDLAAPGTVVTVVSISASLHRFACGAADEVTPWVDLVNGVRRSSGDVAGMARKVAPGWHDTEESM